MPRVTPNIMKSNSKFICPKCGGTLKKTSATFKCASCRQIFNSENGIPLLYWQGNLKDAKKVTSILKQFYEDNPFPNYDDTDSAYELRNKAKKGVFAELLDRQVSDSARILEAGCGTGQLSNFLALREGRDVIATDICLNSLKLGRAFADENKISNIDFIQMNLFKPVFAPSTFDLVISTGVLHDTPDPKGGFESIAKLVKKDGYILISLYNTIGRIPTDIRRIIFSLTGDQLKFLDDHLRSTDLGSVRKKTWFADQYKHPHETKLSIDEVLKWFDDNGFEYINGIPKIDFSEFDPMENLFEKNPRGSWMDHLNTQLDLLVSGGRDGGFFIMIGCKVQ